MEDAIFALSVSPLSPSLSLQVSKFQRCNYRICFVHYKKLQIMLIHYLFDGVPNKQNPKEKDSSKQCYLEWPYMYIFRLYHHLTYGFTLNVLWKLPLLLPRYENRT